MEGGGDGMGERFHQRIADRHRDRRQVKMVKDNDIERHNRHEAIEQ